jgi:dihydroxy-acid dehydratase
VLVEAIRNQLLPRDIVTRKAIENAIAVVMAVGGSTNAVLHFLAIATPPKFRGRSTTSSAFATRVPVLCDLKPSGRYVATNCTAPEAFRK